MGNKNLINVILILFVLYFTASCAADARFRNFNKSIREDSKGNFYIGQKFFGVSSYYADKFHGRKTANGEIYDMHALTAAHKELPFGTIIEVTNLENNKTVKVRINDRGPFKKNRILDLSLKAAKEIDLVRNGTADVEIRIIQLNRD